MSFITKTSLQRMQLPVYKMGLVVGLLHHLLEVHLSWTKAVPRIRERSQCGVKAVDKASSFTPKGIQVMETVALIAAKLLKKMTKKEKEKKKKTSATTPEA